MLNTPTDRHKTERCRMPSLISLSTINKEYKRTDQNSVIAKKPSRQGSFPNLNTQEDDWFYSLCHTILIVFLFLF